MKTDLYRDAMAKLEQGAVEEGRRLLELAVSQAPTEPDPACDLAMLYLEQEQDTRAEQILAPVLAAHPEHARAHLHMAMALAKTDLLRARDHADKALQDTDPERRQQAEVLRRALMGHGLR